MSQTMREALNTARAQIVLLGGVPDPVHGDDIQRAVLEQIDAALSAPSSEQAQQGARSVTNVEDGILRRAVVRSSRPAAAAPAVGVTNLIGALESIRYIAEHPKLGRDEFPYIAQIVRAALAGAAQPDNTGPSDWPIGEARRYAQGVEDGRRDAFAAAGAAQGAEPVGWRLVPVEPTWDMKIAASTAYREARDGHYTARMEQAADCYRAMLAASPQPPTGTEKK